MSNHNSPFMSTAAGLIALGLCPVLLQGKKPVFTSFSEYVPGWASSTDMEYPDAFRYSQATLDAWNHDFPGANVGMLTRERPSIDVDDEGVLQIVWDLLPRTPHVKRGARGWTFIYSHDPADPVMRSRCWSNQFSKGMMLEVLADGRQTVLPPSIHPDTGRPYEWVASMWGDAPTPLNAEKPPVLSQRVCDAIEARLREHGLIGHRRERGAELGRAVSDVERPRYAAYLQPKLIERLEAVRTATRGGRQDALNGAVFALAPWVREGFLTEDWTRDQVRMCCEDNGFIRDDGAKAFERQFVKALDDGWSVPLPDLDAGRLAAMPSWGAFAPEAKPLPPFEAVSLWDELDKPEEPQEWTVEGWLPHEEVTSFYGQGGIGKTTALLQMGVAIATGRPWMGKATVKRRVLYVSGEDKRADMVRMVRGAAQGIPREELANAVFMVQSLRQIASDVYPALGKQNRHDGETVMTELFDRLVEFVKVNKIGAMLLDPVGMLYLGNQNDLSGVYSFLNALCRRICDLGVTVVLSAHPSKSGRREGGDGTSGSVGWDSAPRAVITMRRPNEEDRAYCTITLTKANRGPAGEVVHVRWTPLGFVATNPPDPAQQEAEAVNGPACTMYMDMLRSAIGAGLSVPPRETPGRFADDRAAKLAGVTKAMFTQAQNDLIRQCVIRVQPVGRGQQIVII